jgi:hypothetical protein
MVANQDQLARGAPSELRRPHGIRQVDSAHAQDSGDVAAEAQSDDIDSGEVTEDAGFEVVRIDRSSAPWVRIGR